MIPTHFHRVSKVKSTSKCTNVPPLPRLQCDYSLVQSNLTQLEALCKASWEQLKILDKAEDKRKGGKMEKRKGGGRDDEASAAEGPLRHRLPRILKECEERLKVLRAVHRRVINRCAAGISCCGHFWCSWCFKFKLWSKTLPFFFLQVPLFPLIPGLLPLHGERHHSRGLL